MENLLVLFALIVFVYFWWDTMRSKEAARQAGLHTCKRLGLQFLDDTVSLEKLSWRRNRYGRVVLARRYNFEFTSDGSQRYKGTLQVSGGMVSGLELPPYREPAPQQDNID